MDLLENWSAVWTSFSMASLQPLAIGQNEAKEAF